MNRHALLIFSLLAMNAGSSLLASPARAIVSATMLIQSVACAS